MKNSKLKLVYSDQDKTPMTNSVLVAGKFDKSPYQINETIVKILKDYETIGQKTTCSPFFSRDVYIDSSGRQQPLWVMTEEGFTLVSHRLKGKTALVCQLDYAVAFSAMKRRLIELGQEAPKLLEEKKVELKLVHTKNEKLKKKVVELEKELRPVINHYASVSQHLKLLGLKDRKLITEVLDMVIDKENYRDIVVKKHDKVSKKGYEDDINIKQGTYYDTVTLSPELVEACLICLGISF